MNKNDLLQNLNTYLENNYIRSEKYYETAVRFLERVEDVSSVTADDVKSFLYDTSKTKSTFNTYRSHLVALFKFLISENIITKNPMDDISKLETIELREEVVKKQKRISHEDFRNICNSFLTGGNPIQAAIIASFYEGLSISELAMLEKADVYSNYLILKNRNDYRLHLADYYANILKQAISTTRVNVWVGGVFDVRTDEIVETKFLVRYSKRSRVTIDPKERAKQLSNYYGFLKLPYSINELTMSGMMHYIRQEVKTVEDLTEDKIGHILERYNVSWMEYYEKIKGEF